VAEDDLAAFAEAKAFPIIPCTLCGSQENLQRKVVGRMLKAWEKAEPGRISSILRALTDVRPSQLLDRKLFDFAALKPGAAHDRRDASVIRFRELGEPLFAE
jgi:tRNA 2-thiocytidine biosynthesis protein TtcA